MHRARCLSSSVFTPIGGRRDLLRVLPRSSMSENNLSSRRDDAAARAPHPRSSQSSDCRVTARRSPDGSYCDWPAPLGACHELERWHAKRAMHRKPAASNSLLAKH